MKVVSDVVYGGGMTGMQIGHLTLILVVLTVLLLTAQHVHRSTAEQHITIGQEQQTLLLKGSCGKTPPTNA
jgi:hypothetical protein